jgi:hypothetical protein
MITLLKILLGYGWPLLQLNSPFDVLYPGRIALGLGTGEAMNEVPPGFDWTMPNSRQKRMIEAKEIIDKFGKLIRLEELQRLTAE